MDVIQMCIMIDETKGVRMNEANERTYGMSGLPYMREHGCLRQDGVIQGKVVSDNIITPPTTYDMMRGIKMSKYSSSHSPSELHRTSVGL